MLAYLISSQGSQLEKRAIFKDSGYIVSNYLVFFSAQEQALPYTLYGEFHVRHLTLLSLFPSLLQVLHITLKVSTNGFSDNLPFLLTRPAIISHDRTETFPSSDCAIS